MGEEKVHANIVVLGHVNSGKSVTVGHLIYKLGGFDKRRIGSSFKIAWMLDLPKAERERGTTIDIDKWKFETPKYYCTVIDAPGNDNFIKNMITSISQADCAILVIDSTTGGFGAGISKDGQTREHALLAHTLGVKQIICCCNKMDTTTPKYSEYRYDEIVKELSYCLMTVGYNRDMIRFVPISGFEGDNLIERSSNLYWYKGPTLLEAINDIQELKTPSDKPLRLPLDNVYESGNGTVAVGCVETGILKAGMRITFGPRGFTTKVKALEMNEMAAQMALPGEIVSFTVKKLPAEGLRRGYVASNSKKDPAEGAVNFKAKMIIRDNYEGQISNGSVAVLDCHTSCSSVLFAEILTKIDPGSDEVLENTPEFLKCGDAGVVKMVLRNPMVVEAFSEYPPLGCFVLSDRNQTFAFGIIESVEKKNSSRAEYKSTAKKVGKHAASCMCHALPMVLLHCFGCGPGSCSCGSVGDCCGSVGDCCGSVGDCC